MSPPAQPALRLPLAIRIAKLSGMPVETNFEGEN
jgi:hypothetical protein